MFQKISGILGAMKKKSYHNEGASLLMVIIMISFVGVLVSVAVYSSYYNFFMKYSDRSAKDNFYTVETALDEINVGLQREISASMSEAYVEVSKRSDLDVTQKEDEFKKKLYENVLDRVRRHSAGTDPITPFYEVNRLTLYLDKTRMQGNVGALVLTTDSDAVLEYNTAECSRLVLKKVSLQYTDPRGYVSMLDTDISITMPEISFVSNKEMPEIETYSLIAHTRLRTEDEAGIVQIRGNAYAGGTEGMFPGRHSTFQFGGGGAQYRVIAKKVVAETGDMGGNSVSTLTGSQLWTEGIDVNSANISLLDNTYVKDDLTVDGKNCRITLGGQYFGYGSGNASAAESSSILINGANTTLDMSGLKNLMLLGHAFVGATHYNADTTADDDEYVEDVSTGTPGPHANHSDPMLGQSVAVRSDQMLYKVPDECMGYEGNVQVLAKNPLTLAEYTTLTTAIALDGTGKPVYDAAGKPVLRYKPVDLTKVFAKLGKPLSSYGADYRPVFRKINGSILVTYYLYFTSEDMANRFFQDYFNADPDAFDTYVRSYLADFKWNNDLGRRDASGQMTNPLRIAGNLVYFDRNGKATLRQDTKTADMNDISEITASVDQIQDTYEALYAKLILNRNNLSSSELGKTAYENIVLPEAQFDAFVAKGSEKEFENGLPGDEEVKALVANNKGYGELTIDAGRAKNLYFVVASGDVKVTAPEFKGVIISGGTITITSTCTLMEAEPSKARQALRCYAVGSDAVNGPFAAEILIDGDAYLNYSTVSDNSVASANEYGFIEIADLIHYENWNKK